jgi:hypothetical protein
MGKFFPCLVAVVAIAACGDTTDGYSGGAGGDVGEPRTAEAICNEVCGWPDECFVAFGVPVAGDCAATCESSVETVGIACVQAIADTVACLGTCDVESITEQRALACQDDAERIGASCD